MTDNDAISIVCRNIKNKYPEMDVEKEKVNQDAVQPLFYVYIIQSTKELKLGKKHSQLFKIAVKYYSENETNEECMNVAAVLCEAFKIMEYNGRVVKAKKMEYKVVDGVLHFYFDITNTELVINENNKFGELEVNVDAK